MGYDMNLVKPDPEVDTRVAEVSAAFSAKAKERDDLAKELGDVKPTWGKNVDPIYADHPALQALQAEVSRLYEEMYRVNTNYFRANIWGMGQLREDMDTLGMLDTTAGYSSPPWPELGDYGLTEWPDSDSKLLTPSQRKFLAATDAAKAQEAKDVVGIPMHKFGSNDGWVVTPAEITYALKMHETADGDARRAIRETWMSEDGSGYCRWDAWIAFLEIARDKGEGFEVW